VNRKIIGIVAAIVLASFGTLSILLYVRGIEARALAGEQAVEVLVASQTIPEGTLAEGLRDYVDAKQVPAKVRTEGAVVSLGDLDGLVASVDLLPGEQITRARFIAPEVFAQQGQVEVPDGLLQVAVELEPQRARGGLVRPGDTVAVLASFDPFDVDGEGETSKTSSETHVLMNKVLVTDVRAGGQAVSAGAVDATVGADEDDAAPTSNLMVTLAMDAPSVERLIFTAEFGHIWLVDEPEDAPEDGIQIQDRATIYGR
jgi:pilus assembly protein CpaB